MDLLPRNTQYQNEFELLATTNNKFGIIIHNNHINIPVKVMARGI